MQENVTIKDIQEISKGMNINLTNEQLNNILMEFNREVMDKGEGWDELIKILIMKWGTIQLLKDIQNPKKRKVKLNGDLNNIPKNNGIISPLVFKTKDKNK